MDDWLELMDGSMAVWMTLCLDGLLAGCMEGWMDG
jgi:hypothetical protein